MLKCAESVWRTLNGVICVYKPNEASCDFVKNVVVSNLCRDLNNLETRPPEKYLDILHTENGISVQVRPSYADNVLCVGPRYQPEDFEIYFPSYLGRRTSGIVVLGINKGCSRAAAFKNRTTMKCYHINGILGQATANFHIDEAVIARGKYNKVNKILFDKILASYQASYQQGIFKEYGVNLRSQKAYDMAVAGFPQSKEKKNPRIYGIKCVNFEPPEFTLEVKISNANEIILMNLIHNIGISLKCYATCTGLRCIKYGCFTLDHALLKKHWNLENILQNMDLCLNVFNKSYPINADRQLLSQ